MNDILCRQMALDYCCTPEEVRDRRNHFTEHRFLEGRRRYREGTECFLKLAVINGKILFTGREEIIAWCRETWAEAGSEWFLEAGNLRTLDDRLRQDGYQIDMMHPFFIPKDFSSADPSKADSSGANRSELYISAADRSDMCISAADTRGYEIRWYHGEEIEQFRGDNRFNEAFTYCPEAPDVIGVAALRGGSILGMAGASCDSPTMWQIGINVNPGSREAGIGKMLVTLLKNKILKKGILPYYGTAVSHLASQKVALGAGFAPAWVELTTSKI